MNMRIDFEALNQAALARCPGLLETLLPGGKVAGQNYECANLNGGHGQSLKVGLNNGKWSDFATADAGGGDLISLMAAIENIRQGEAAVCLAEMIGFNLPENAAPKNSGQQKERPSVILPVPEDALAPDFRHCRLGQPAEVFTYRNQAGQTLGCVCRFATGEMGANGKPKMEFAPKVFTGEGWKWQGFNRPYPFYGLENHSKLPAVAKIVVVEGEHKADALKSLAGANMGVLGLYGGYNRIAGMDFSPLRGKNVY